ncbi:FAD-dependent monooxygenase [Nonomuraea sp. NPDC049152]|uniref:FAD-dependent monooxygenase n=1 Tax=Nonomuraea sp. NPDC049152 TaxID=3154350 RepID=UPI0033D9D15A
MRILISGGGVAGLTLAYWLHHRGFTPVVVERSPEGQVGGYGIDFFGTGYDIAERMGLVQRLEQGRIPADSVAFVNEAGRVRARLERRLVEEVVEGPSLPVMHGTLEQALAGTVNGNVEIRHQQTITEVRQSDDGVAVTFADGREEDFDLLIGADGVHSATRRLVFGPERDYARHLGYHLACFPLPDDHELGPTRFHYTSQGRQVVVYRTDRPGEMIALFLYKARDEGVIPRAARLARLRKEFAGMGWITPRLLDGAPADASIFMDSMTQIVMPGWHHGRVALVGDACGCMTLVSAQGVSMAMGGAYLLAKALHRHLGDHRAAFAEYERRMLPEVAHRQRNARAVARTLIPSTRLGTSTQNLVMRLLARKVFAPVLRRRFGAGSILAAG